MALLLQLVLNSLIAGATYAIIALGFNLVYGATRFVNLAYGAVSAFGGYMFFLLARQYGIETFLSIIIAVFASGVLGVITDRLVFSPLRRRKASNRTSFVASVGIFTMLQAIFEIAFGTEFKPLAAASAAPTVYQIGGAAITSVEVIIAALAIIFYCGLFVVLKYTKFGRAVRAVQDDEEVARVLGIHTDRIIMWLFFIGSAIAGTAGILIGFDIGINTQSSLLILLEGAVASIIGGIGALWGGFLGAFILGAVENFSIYKIGGEWKPAVTFLVLAVFLIVRPRGLFKR